MPRLSISPEHLNTSPETLSVLVAMIAFQEDNEPRTSGNGSFDTSVTTQKIIDPPPHNRAYVQNHMFLAENYFRKVSNRKLIVKITVLDDVYRLAQQMAVYSPPRTSTDNHEIGKLMQDAWHAVDSLTPGIQFQNYKAFVIIHAGVGRDVDLSSQLGFDPTPFDIPSLYINLAALRKMFGPSYNGIPIDGGTFSITNSIILPETESRVINTGLGNALLQLGINGLIVASIGSHLGLPDLFDTKTGRTGIGRFGLMDGQSIFSWNGVFPPEPSAWEKYFLGWISPITVPPGEAVYSLPAVSLSNDPDSVYRVPISAKEYFLVENRNRDANRDGAIMTIERNGEIVQRTFYRDTTHFNAFDQDSIYGNVIDVDEFDWSLPGGVNTRTGEWFDGGLLIWHIDETVIDASYANDAVNANPARRGVNLEEADGSQDIGQSYGFISAGAGSEDGTPLDFWYSGNAATPRRLSNEFTPNSNPTSLSNDFANSHIYVKEFSQRGPRMTAKIQLGDEQVRLVQSFPKNVDRRFGVNSLSVGKLPNGEDVIVAATSNTVPNRLAPDSGLVNTEGVSLLYAWKLDGSSLPGLFSSGLVAESGNIPPGEPFFGSPVVGEFTGDQFIDIGIAEKPWAYPGVRTWTTKDVVGNDSLGDPIFYTQPPQAMTSSLIKSDSFFVVGTYRNGLTFLSESGSIVNNLTLNSGDTTSIVGVSLWNSPDEFLAVDANGRVSIATPTTIIRQKYFSRSMTSPAATGVMSSILGKRIAFTSKDGYVYLVDSGLVTQSGFPLSTGGEILNSPALADIDGDGQKDIIVFSGNKIFAINASGAVLDNFPIAVATSKTILTSPIVADLDGSGTPDIVAVTQEGLVVAYDRTGKMVRGFPLLAGVNGGSTPAAFIVDPGISGCLSCPISIGLAVASDDGHVYAWLTGSVSSMVVGVGPILLWPQYMHDAQNTGLDESSTPLNINQTFFPSSRAYNWPNPVRAADNFRTHIRYYVASNANVTVKIFDMAGDLVADLTGAGVGGLDNEIEWDVSEIQSGVYFAHIDAQGANGSGSAVIKIAVVK